MLWNRKYKYPTSRREIIDGKRHYEINNEKLPSCTEILNATMPIEKKEKLNQWVEKVGKKEIREYEQEESDDKLYQQILKEIYQKCYDIAKKGTKKDERSKSFNELKEALIEKFSDDEDEDEKIYLVKKYFSKVQKEAVRELVLSEGLRLDGRSTDQIRPIWTEIDYLPSTHGSSIFSRGETQSLATVTLGT